MQAPPGKRLVPDRGRGTDVESEGVDFAFSFDDSASDEPSLSCAVRCDPRSPED